MPIELLTPPGRIVWGHPMEKQIKTDPKTRKAILGKDGKEQNVWAYGLAIPANQFAPVEQAIAQAAYQLYPSGNFPRDFAWKIKRETDLDEQNKPYRDREGYAGCVVLTISTQAFCPSVYKFENGQYRQLTEQELKCGDWVVAKLSIDAHQGGVYINPVAAELVGYDKEIVRRGAAANPNEVFGGRQYQLPPGVSATPVGGAPAGYAMPGQPPAPAVGYQPPYQPAPVAAAPVGYPAVVASQPAVYTPPVAGPAPGYQPAPVAHMPPPAHDFVRNAGIIPGQSAPAGAVGYPPAGMPGIPTGR